ncbi:hypothetical protein L208DRAFT_1382928 [Tricholoma matsutake]|nr:hypothetical protein L208DRAFT_1382928 [Tricholoma matsutake 945]
MTFFSWVLDFSSKTYFFMNFLYSSMFLISVASDFLKKYHCVKFGSIALLEKAFLGFFGAVDEEVEADMKVYWTATSQLWEVVKESELIGGEQPGTNKTERNLKYWDGWKPWVYKDKYGKKMVLHIPGLLGEMIQVSVHKL